MHTPDELWRSRRPVETRHVSRLRLDAELGALTLFQSRRLVSSVRVVGLFLFVVGQLSWRQVARFARTIHLGLLLATVADLGDVRSLRREALIIAKLFIIKSLARARDLLEGEMTCGIHRNLRAVELIEVREHVAIVNTLSLRTHVATRFCSWLTEPIEKLAPSILVAGLIGLKYLVEAFLLGNHGSCAWVVDVRVDEALGEILHSVHVALRVQG